MIQKGIQPLPNSASESVYDDYMTCILQVLSLVSKNNKDKVNSRHVDFLQPVLLVQH